MKEDLGGQAPARDLTAVLERGKTLELGGQYEIPPGDPITHFGAGFAKIMASNVFLGGLSPEFAAEHVGYFTAPYEDREHVEGVDVDTGAKTVTVRLDNGVSRTARIFQSQGAITLPLDEDDVYFKPSTVTPKLAKQALAWPDAEHFGFDGSTGLPKDVVEDAMARAFAEDAMTAAMVITHKGKLIAERYRPGIDIDTPLESWSMGKSLTATLLGLLMQEGEYVLDEPAPIPEWQVGEDPRRIIRIRDILNMSSGLRFRAMQDPGYDASLGYPDHLYVYTGGINAFEFAATRPQQWPPNTVGRYRNCDPLLANYLVRLAVEGRGDDYHAFPQKSLFDRLGMGNMILETDPYGNFLTQGYEFGSARNWARLGNLYLNDGVWNDERLLPEGFVDFVSTLAPAWVADGRPIYGGFFWINGDGALPIPENAYFMGGAGDQRTYILPDQDLVVVRLGHYSGFSTGASTRAIRNALARLMQAFD